MKKQEKRNPLSEKPLHHAGQSLDQELAAIKFAKILLSLLFFVVFIQLLGDWWNWYRRVVYNPIPEAIFVVIIGIGVLFFNSQLVKKATRIKLGRDGEKIVGQELDKLKTHGYAVIHDVVAKSGKSTFNIDHVIVAPQGIFAVETKTYSKPAKEKAEAYYDGEKVVMTGKAPDRTSVKQAQANALWLKEQLEKKTQRNYHVTPVLVYPGWWVKPHVSKEIWVLNPEGLAIHIPNLAKSLSDLEVKHITYLLSLMDTDE
jgi:hypothetical protein